jgi:hypothetical protein
MCRNIKTLFNFDPPATPDEVREASVQFIRKISGYAHPSTVNEPAFDSAVDEITRAASQLIQSLKTTAPARNREAVAAAARARTAKRFPRR